MTLTRLIAAISVIAALLLPPLARAGEGHDHGDDALAPTGPALPRFAATSDLFELVGVLKGRQITLYLDRTADNAPVTDALIELEIAGTKVKVEKHEDVFEAVLAAEPQPGVLPITATVTAGKDMDLLVGELDLHEEAHATETTHVQAWKAYGRWAAGALASIVILTLLGRRIAAARQRSIGAAT